jgi:hypothetical protein
MIAADRVGSAAMPAADGAASGAKKGNVCRKCSREPALRLDARLRNGFGRDALPSMVSLPYLAFGWGYLTMCVSTVV